MLHTKNQNVAPLAPNSRSDVRSRATDDNQTSKDDHHASEIKKVTKLGVMINLALAMSKAATGIAIGSTGMVADAVNSGGDLLMDAAVYVTVLYSRQGSTPDKPWGSGKVESMGALGVGALLMASGFGIGYSSLSDAVEVGLLLQPSLALDLPLDLPAAETTATGGRSLEMNAAALAVLATSITLKEYLFRKTLRCGQAANSSVVMANAWNHRSDVFVSAAVAAGLVGGMLDYPLLDPLVGVLVSGILVRQGLVTALGSLRDLSDVATSPEETEALRRTCLSVRGIKSVEHLQARLSGPYLFVECTVGVPGTITASAAHRLSELAKEALLREHPGRVADVTVHADPIGLTGLGGLLPHWARDHEQIIDLVKDTLREKCAPEIQYVTEVQVYYKDDGSVGVHVEVAMQENMTIAEANAVARRAKRVLQANFPGMTYIDIDLELDFNPTNDHHRKFRGS